MSTPRDEHSALSRRDLLKGAAFASAALGGAGLFSPAIAEAITAGTHPDLAPPAPALRASMKGVRFNRHEVVRFGIVGTGLRGRSVLSELLAIDNAKIVAVCALSATMRSSSSSRARTSTSSTRPRRGNGMCR
jgi:hypothetical protein